MYRYIILMLISFVSSFFEVCGQNKIIFSDDFSDDNKNQWPTIKTDEFSVEIINNSLLFSKAHKNKEKNGCLWYKKEIPNFQTKNNFIISFDATIISADDLIKGFDFQWGTIDDMASKIGVKTSLYQLNFCLTSVRLSRFNNLDGWTYFDWSDYQKKDSEKKYSLTLGKKYKYLIEQIDSTLKVYINNTLLYEIAIDKQIGNCIGVQQCIKSNWAMSNLVIRQ